MIEIFRTTVQTPQEAASMLRELQLLLPGAEVHFALDDWERILRVRHDSSQDWRPLVKACLTQHGYSCEPLEDVAEPFNRQEKSTSSRENQAPPPGFSLLGPIA